MPSMANITVKNAANADVVYVAGVPSAGDKSPARWSLDAASPVIGLRPVFTVQTRDNGNKSARVLHGSIAYPITSVVAGVTQRDAVVPGTFEVTIPTNVDATLVNDAFVQFGNLIASALIRSVAASGYAPT